MPRPKSFDQDAILDQAVDLFWERGYEGTSLADLEAHLGLGRQSLYNAYGDKQALFLKALDRYRRTVAGDAVTRLSAAGLGLDAIRGFFRWSVDMLTVPGARRGCMVANTILERGPQDPDALLRCNHARDVLLRGFRRALTAAKAKGEVSASLDVEAAAILLVTHNYGLCVLSKTGVPAEELRASVEALLAALR
jgi:TetR/AcrR family transcriptional repressor of nem operon